MAIKFYIHRIAVMTSGGNVILRDVSISARTNPLIYSYSVFHIHLPMLTNMESQTVKKIVVKMEPVVSHSGVADQNLLC